MSPLNRLMNYSAELTQTPPFFSKNISSRLLTTLCIPLELFAVLENTIKLPLQTATFAVKIPAKILNLPIGSKSLKEFESQLATPLDILKTALKIVGYVVGLFFTMSLGIFSPYKNFHLHTRFGLVTDQHAEKIYRLIEENKQKEIDSYEKILEIRLKNIVDVMHQKTLATTLLSPKQLQDIEIVTKVPCPAIKEIIQESIIPQQLEQVKPPESLEMNERVEEPSLVPQQLEPTLSTDTELETTKINLNPANTVALENLDDLVQVE